MGSVMTIITPNPSTDLL